MCDKCKNFSKFYVHQRTIPQELPGYGMETFPAGRSIVSCGKHLAQSVLELSSLSYKTADPVTVSIIKREVKENRGASVHIHLP